MTFNNKIIVVWLGLVCIVIYFMILVGGITRLTGSGLSMVDWKPIMGVIPPLSSLEWQATFDAYKQFPQYQKVNAGMTVEAFKSIYYWEYGHRLLGRAIGIIFFVPFAIMLASGRIEAKLIPKLWVALVLGGLQGLMGWYMVKSGLIDNPWVSHYRLAAHFLLAIFIIGFLYALILDTLDDDAMRASVPRSYRNLVLIVALLLAIQLLMGAFTAGLKAGHGFNTYPLMHGQFLADAALMMQPLWMNFFENGAMVQFVHRWMGAALLAAVVVLFLWSMKSECLVKPAIVLLFLTVLQFVLGVLTLLFSVPISLGSSHQAVACLLVIAVVHMLHRTRRHRIVDDNSPVVTRDAVRIN